MNARRARLLAASLLLLAWLIALGWMAREADRPRPQPEAPTAARR